MEDRDFKTPFNGDRKVGKSILRSIVHSIGDNEDVKRCKKKHTVFFSFFVRRTDPNIFSGLPLSLIVLSFLYVLSLFGGLTEDVLRSGTLVFVDMRVANLFAIFRTQTLVDVFLWITMLGNAKIVLLFALWVSFILWIWNKRAQIIPLFISIVGAGGSAYLLKLAFHRIRPETAVYVEHSFSFPSGHATFSVALYGFITYLFMRFFVKWQYKVNALLIGLLIITLLGFSRLYLGVHYASDVLAGYLVGASWLITAIGISEYFLRKKKQKVSLTIDRAKTGVSTALISIVAAILFVVFGFMEMPDVSLLPAYAPKLASVDNPVTLLQENQLQYTETLTGATQEPLSFIILAKDDSQIIHLFDSTGWVLADDVSLMSVYNIAKAAVLKDSYPTAPMTPDFWNAQVHDFGFEKETDANNVRTRHHARFWKTEYIVDNTYRVYVGTASFDSGIKWGVTHQIDPNIDGEREFLFNDLQATELLDTYNKIQFVDAKLGENFTGDPFFTDGELYLLYVSE